MEARQAREERAREPFPGPVGLLHSLASVVFRGQCGSCCLGPSNPGKPRDVGTWGGAPPAGKSWKRARAFRPCSQGALCPKVSPSQGSPWRASGAPGNRMK